LKRCFTVRALLIIRAAVLRLLSAGARLLTPL